MQDLPDSDSHSLNVAVGQLINRPPVTATPDISIQEAARLMSREGISALVIADGRHLLGIITDRDLRSRCIAEGMPTTHAVGDIMTRNLHLVTPDTPVFEAVITMMRHNIHHLPVVIGSGMEGIITATDLIRYQSKNPVHVVDSLRKCNSVAELVQASAVLPELQVQLVAAGANAWQLGQTITTTVDAITQRLLELAETELGTPPAAYVWTACGSQGRREQTIHSDQDNALILADEYVEEQHGDYFRQLAHYVTDGLDACGIVHCPGDVMASNPQWRQPWRVWRQYFSNWMQKADRKTAMLATNFFDMRPVHGDAALHARLHAEVLHQARDANIFIAYMAGNAIATRPPQRLSLMLKGARNKSVDIKSGGILPVINLARVYALSAGIPELNTIERLRAAATLNTVSADGAADLQEAFEFLITLRARHQARQTRLGERPDNHVKPGKLSALERSHLRDVFAVVRRMQTALAQRYQTARLS